MNKACITHIEVVLSETQQLPTEFLALSENWKYLAGGFYSIAHTDILQELTGFELQTLKQLQEQKKIIEFTCRAVSSPQTDVKLPDWAEP
jgi:hypothetical protein